MATQKTFTWEYSVPKWSFYMGQVKELWGTSILAWVDGVLLKPTQAEITTNIKPNAKRTRKTKASV